LQRNYEAVLGTAAHDLQDPLRRIAIFADLRHLRYGDLLDDRAKHYLDGMTGEACRGRELIEQKTEQQ